MENCKMADLKYSGSFFTWNNKQKPEERIFSTIDRAMVNTHWINVFPSSEVVFLPELSFDHSPILVTIYEDRSYGKKPFRLRKILPDLIAENQGGFVHGRFIAHNVLVCQDLVRLYGRKNCKPNCMIKIYLRKAYNTIEWEFLEEMMTALGFPGMEYLSRFFTKVGEWPGFKFHDICAFLKLNHMCFADDLLVFCNGDFISVMLLLKGLKLFSTSSGLLPNEQKTAIYCSGMPESEVSRILEASNFTRSSLPFRYLGIHARNEVLWNQQVWLINTTVKKSQQMSKLGIKGLLPKKAKVEDKTWILMV
uniref:Reverse transcriptase n=1 Tax=Cannabis sativa TaxID=3483 RepID=A0A803PSJ0_CANSA